MIGGIHLLMFFGTVESFFAFVARKQLGLLLVGFFGVVCWLSTYVTYGIGI